MSEELLSQREVEERLSLPEKAFTRLRRAGADLPARYKIGGRYYYKWNEVQVWLNNQKETSAPTA